MSQAKSEEKKDDKKKLILIIFLLLFIIIGLVFFIFFMKKNDSGDDKAVDRKVLVDEDNAEEMVKKIANQDYVETGSYEVKMNTTWNFKNGKSASDNAYVANVERNTNPVYFDLVRSDTNEVILASPIIPLGKKMDNITLDTVLEKGTYDCVCTYHLIDDENKPISKVSVEVTVNVQS